MAKQLIKWYTNKHSKKDTDSSKSNINGDDKSTKQLQVSTF